MGMHRAVGGLSAKINPLCDAPANLPCFYLMLGQVFDPDNADVLIDKIETDTLLTDKGYVADARVRNRLGATSIESAMVPKANSKELCEYDKVLYKARHLVENFLENSIVIGQLRRAITKPQPHFLALSTSLHLSFDSIDDTA